MADQEQNSNINITKHYTYNVYSQSVQIGDDNKLQTTCETDGMGNMEYDVEQLKVTVAAQGQKLKNLTGQLENQAEQLSMIPALVKRIKQFVGTTGNGENKHSPRITHNSTITLSVFLMPRQYKGEIQVGKDITVIELKVKLQQKFGGVGVIAGIISKEDGEVYKDVTGDDDDDSTRTLSSLSVQEGDEVVYW